MSAILWPEPKNRETWLCLDYLIYSSHKTGTQTLNQTLNRNGFRSRHCHYLQHVDLEPDDLNHLAGWIHRETGKRLKLISVFREPVERYISSFFRNTAPVRYGEKWSIVCRKL